MEIEKLIEPVLKHLESENPGDVLGVYLYGSGVATGLRPSSDIDLLVLTQRSLTLPERTSLISTLLKVSGWNGNRDRFPDVGARRPLEVTSLVVGEIHSPSTAPSRDFQFGEWLREDFLTGYLSPPAPNADVVILLATARSAHRVVHGPELERFVARVPPLLLQQAQLAVVPDLIGNLVGDERNVLLTLARILITIETGQIVSKDRAAEQVAPRLAGQDRALLELAREDYLGSVSADWSGKIDLARTCSQTLTHLINEAADAGSPDGALDAARN